MVSVTTEVKQCFSVNIDEHGAVQADWQFGSSGWDVSKKEGVRWESDPFTLEAYEAVLAHFRLTGLKDKLSMKVVQEMSPAALQACRAVYEKGRQVNVSGLDPVSQRRGFEDVRASRVH